MAFFELQLNLNPSFHRSCSVRIEGDETGTATFEATQAGILPPASSRMLVIAEKMATLHAHCLHMFEAWDERWSRSGIDGISMDGRFDSSDSTPRTFSLWSPRNSAAHTMLAVALDCFPYEQCSGIAQGLLENIRGYLDLQPPFRVTTQGQLRIRLAESAHHKYAADVEKALRALPDESDLIIDASSVPRFGLRAAGILPIVWLLKRSGLVRWIAQSGSLEALVESGIDPSRIEIVQKPALTYKGDPIVLGSLVVSSPELIALATSHSKTELVRAFRQQYGMAGMTVDIASQAAAELIGIVESLRPL